MVKIRRKRQKFAGGRKTEQKTGPKTGRSTDDFGQKQRNQPQPESTIVRKPQFSKEKAHFYLSP